MLICVIRIDSASRIRLGREAANSDYRDGFSVTIIWRAFGGGIQSERTTHAAICDLDENPILARILATWLATVARLMNNSRAITGLVSPLAISLATSSSRAVRVL